MMLERGRGHIVNIASLAGRFATPGSAIYGATKHAVVAFSEALYHELGPKGVLVTSVNPGFSPTEGFPAIGPTVVRLDPDDVAKLIVDVVRRDGRGDLVPWPSLRSRRSVLTIPVPLMWASSPGATASVPPGAERSRKLTGCRGRSPPSPGTPGAAEVAEVT
jgi:short-subunit dehydrogenase